MTNKSILYITLCRFLSTCVCDVEGSLKPADRVDQIAYRRPSRSLLRPSRSSAVLTGRTSDNHFPVAHLRFLSILGNPTFRP